MQPYPYNRSKGRKPGVFNNAVYSKVVSTIDDPNVRRGVDEDLRTILKKPSYNDSRRWNYAPGEDSKSELIDPKRIRMPGRGLNFLKKPDEMVIRRMQKENDEVEPPSKRVSASFDLINNFNDIVHSAGLKIPTAQKTKPAATKVRFNAADNVFEIDDRPIDDHLFVPTPTASNTFNKLTERRLTDSDLAAENPFLGDFPVGDTDNRANNSKQLWDDDVEFLNSPEHGGRGVSLLLSDAMKEKQKRNENIQPKAFPASIPVSEILTRTSESFPKLTLRNGHPLTYSALISDICRKSVQRSKQSERENKSTVKGDSSPDSLMDYMNTTVCQAARENLEMIRNLPLPTSNSLGTEAPSSADVGGQFTFNLNSSFHLNGNDDDLFLRSSP